MNAQQQRSQRIKVAAFVTGTLAVFIAAVMVLGHPETLFARKAILQTSFANTGGLIAGAAVRLAGVDIGIVKAIHFDKNISGRRVDVTLAVEAKYLERIRGDSVAQINSKGLLGDMIVDITLGSEDTPAHVTGDQLESVEASGLAQVVAGVQDAIKKVDVLIGDVDDRLKQVITPQVSSDIGRIAHSAATLVEGVEHGKGLVHALIYEPTFANSTGQILRDFQRIATRVDGSIDQIQRFLTDARTGDNLVHSLVYEKKGGLMVAELERTTSDLSAMTGEVKDGNGLIHSLIYEKDKTNLVQNLSDAARILKQLVDETNQGKGTLGGLLKDPTVYEDLTTLLGNIKRNVLLKALIRYTIVKDDLTRPGRIEVVAGEPVPP